MSNKDFSILYNGHPVAVAFLDNNTYLAQVSYKPIKIKLTKDSEGLEKWIDTETGLETFVSEEVGKLISKHLAGA